MLPRGHRRTGRIAPAGPRSSDQYVQGSWPQTRRERRPGLAASFNDEAARARDSELVDEWLRQFRVAISNTVRYGRAIVRQDPGATS